MNIMLPAYDQNKKRPAIILEFTRECVIDYSKPAPFGQRFTHKPHALVSTENGLIELVDVKDLVILWDIVPRVRDGRIIVPSFGAIRYRYEEILERGQAET